MLKKLLLLLFVAALSLTACSTIHKSVILRIDPVNADWKQTQFGYHRGYKFQYETVSVVVHDVVLTTGYRQPDSWVAFLGPPLLPIFPLEWLAPAWSYDFLCRFEMESLAKVTTLDLANIKVFFSGEKSIQPSVALVGYKMSALSFSTKVKDDSCVDVNRIRICPENSKPFQPQRVTVSNEKRGYELKYDELPAGVKEIFLDFGYIKIDDKEVKLPPIKYSKGHEVPVFSTLFFRLNT